MYPRNKVIFVDVDGTLHQQGIVNQVVVDWCKDIKSKGFTLVLWSMRGSAYARESARLIGIEDLFEAIISKPGYILDDDGWSWVKYTQVIRNGNILHADGDGDE